MENFLLLLILLPLNLVGFKHINKQLSIRMEKMQKDAASANKRFNCDIIKCG